MKKHLPSPKKLTLAIFFSAFFVLSLPQISASFLGGKANFGPFPLSSFQVHAQTNKGFFDQILDPIRKFFSRQPGLAPDSLTGESDLPDLEVTSFNYLGEGQSDPNRVWFGVVNNNRSGFSDSDSSDNVVVRLYGYEGDEYPYTRTPLAELAIPKGVLEENLTTSPSFSYKDNIRNIPDLSQCVALEVCVDDENSISESNEENNCLFKTFGDCWKCYENKCKDRGIDFCLGAASETWRREDMKEFSVGSYGDAIYANWTYNPVVYRTSERKEVYQIPFQLCINNAGFSGENGWVNGPHSLTGRGGDVLGKTDNDVGAKPFFGGSAFRACSTSHFIIKMRDLNEWASDINYASATLSSAHGLWRNIVFVIEGPNLVVRKFVDGQPGVGWNFRAEITDPPDASVCLGICPNIIDTKVTDKDGEAGFSVIYTPGQNTALVSVAEVPNPNQQSNYKLVGVSCRDEHGNEVGVPDLDRYVVENIPTDAEKKVYCDFLNVSPREIIVEKYIDSEGPEPGWEITPSVSETVVGVPDAEIVPNNTQSTTAAFKVYPGANKTVKVTLTEDVKSGYEFVSVECHYPSDPSDPDNTLSPVVGIGGEITIDIDYADTDPNHALVNCRFNNTRKTEITVRKYIGGIETADWTITADLPTGTTTGTTTIPPADPLTFNVYPNVGTITNVTLTETVKSGYEFERVTCEYQDGTEVNGSNSQIIVPVNYDNLNHAVINCKFYNKRRTKMRVEKYVDGNVNLGAGWHIAPAITDGEIFPPHPQLTTPNPAEPLVYRVYPEVGKTARVVLTETLKQNYYEFDHVACYYQNGDEVGTAGNGKIVINILYDDTNPGHEIINCKFYNNTIPSKMGNLKMSFDYKDCMETGYEPEAEVIKVISTADDGTKVLRHNQSDLNPNWLDWSFDDSSWEVPKSVWDRGVPEPGGYESWTDTGFVPDGYPPPSYKYKWPFMKKDSTESPKVIQATNNAQQVPWTKDFFRKKFTIPSNRRVISAKLYTASDNLVKFWLKKSDDATIFPLIGEGNNLNNNGNTEYAQDSQEESGIHIKEVNLGPGNYVLGANLLNWQPFYNCEGPKPGECNQGDTHPMGIQFLLYIETVPIPESCNARDDNGTCSAGSCSCSQNSNTHMVNCDYGVDEGWNYTLHNVKPIISTFVNPAPGKITGDLRTPSGLTIPTNSETYSIEVNWSYIWSEGHGGNLIPRNCNAQDPSNPNNSPFCHVYNIGFDINLELHARKLSIQVMNPQDSGWIDIGGCTQLDPVVSPNTYSCDLSNALLTGDTPDLHQDYVKLRFTFEAPGCEENQDGICPDDTLCGKECTILAGPSYDSDCCCNYDLYQDGVIDGRDCGRITTIGDDRFGTRPGDPGYDPFYDLNGDGIIDHGDVQFCISSCYEKKCVGQFNPIALLSFSKGDANGDNKTDNLDYAIWLASYLKSREADFSGDGVTNELDYVVWWKNYGGKTL